MLNINLTQALGFGYKSVMKHVATDNHVHCAYGGEVLSPRHPATAEHVRCHSAGGSNSDYNFLPVCEKHNGERANMRLPVYLSKHPDAIPNIKRTINEMSQIKTPYFDGRDWAEHITKTVEQEAGRDLNLDFVHSEYQVARPVQARVVPRPILRSERYA